MLVGSTNKKASLDLDLDLGLLGLGMRADEVEEGGEAQVRGRPMLIKKRRSRVEFFMLRKSASARVSRSGGWRSLL